MLFRSEPVAARRDAAEQLGLRHDLPTVVVVGGSLGALRLNEAAIGAFPLEGVQALVLAGAAHVEGVRAALGGRSDVRVEPYLDRMELAYEVADLIVARAGASSCAEIAACGIPAVLVPYPFATADHQTGNARALVDVGAAERIPDEALTPALLRETVARFLGDRARLEAMAAAARSVARPRAAEDLAALLRSVA